MTHGSPELLDDRHRRRIFIAALIMWGVCLFVVIVWLSFCTPLAIEDENGLIEELYRLPR
jgi:hypothetical protein